MPGEQHVLVVANETVAGESLIKALREQAEHGPMRVTVVCPINQPRHGSVVYEDTRRAAARRRLERTLAILRDAEIPAHGLVVDADPVQAVRDALELDEVDQIVVSTHPQQRSGWLRRDDGDVHRARLRPPAQRLDQALAAHRLVGNDQHPARRAHTFVSSSSVARSPFSTAWRAPGTPYSYGFPTTCGISSKLKTGGGDETCHSIVKPRHGFASAIGPRRIEMAML